MPMIYIAYNSMFLLHVIVTEALCVCDFFCLFVQTEPMEGYQESPYPEIDCFVRSLINKDGVQGGNDCAIIYR